MHSGQFVFYQITNRFKRQFNRIVCKYNDRTKGWSFTHWNHLCVLIFAQLSGCASLRELVDIIQAHAKRSYNLGFGTLTPNRSVISKSNTLRDYRIYEEFAFYMVGQAQKRRITKEFELRGRFYAVDSTIIDLCLSVFRWAAFRTTKSGIRIHTQIDIATEIPVFYRITNANIHDVNSMDWIEYEKLACYVFDRGYFDLARLFAIEKAGAFFIIREKFRPDYEIEEGEDLLDGEDNVLRDQTVRFSSKRNKSNYPTPVRRIVYYAPELHRSFTYYTNNFFLKAKEIALLYKYRWQVELFFYDKYNVMRSERESTPEYQLDTDLLLRSTSHNDNHFLSPLSQSRRFLLDSQDLSESRLGVRSVYAFSNASRFAFESARA